MHSGWKGRKMYGVRKIYYYWGPWGFSSAGRIEGGFFTGLDLTEDLQILKPL